MAFSHWCECVFKQIFEGILTVYFYKFAAIICELPLKSACLFLFIVVEFALFSSPLVDTLASHRPLKVEHKLRASAVNTLIFHSLPRAHFSFHFVNFYAFCVKVFE